MNSFSQKLSSFIQSQASTKSICLWRLPHESMFHLICTANKKRVDDYVIENLAEGYIVAPFSSHHAAYFFPADNYYTFHSVTDCPVDKQVAKENTFTYPPSPTDFSTYSYTNAVEEAIQQIKKKQFEKVVLARYEDITKPSNFNPIERFLLLCEKFPDAFVQFIFDNEIGCWISASPEIIIQKTKDGILKTVSLAGTQRIQNNSMEQVAWKEKEIVEQAMVSRYIIDCFKKIRVREFKEYGPRTVRAGEMAHLKTDIEVNLHEVHFPNLASTLLKLLHPTSAVCGMPIEPARQFIQQQEKFDRQYYTGFSGPIHLDNACHLYVIIRCAQIFSSAIRLYAGAGITEDSHSSSEWEETEWKLAALKPYLL